jgi:hypothetical protein
MGIAKGEVMPLSITSAIGAIKASLLAVNP